MPIKPPETEAASILYTTTTNICNFSRQLRLCGVKLSWLGGRLTGLLCGWLLFNTFLVKLYPRNYKRPEVETLQVSRAWWEMMPSALFISICWHFVKKFVHFWSKVRLVYVAVQGGSDAKMWKLKLCWMQVLPAVETALRTIVTKEPCLC